ncbi:hypothetical protein [Salinibacterium sp. ZJ454]|uniref:hypothetical protein n=1 Tax=Salinibacterium sp. ZJ454 TaxID=2708339 RepID=UPI001423110D|nr:hypothetical protein [Salinibacterium sp. ZJ454]
MADAPDDRIVRDIRALIALAVDRLAAANAHDEALAEFVPPKRVLLFTKDAVMKPLGRVWRLGVFLLGHDGTLYRVGSTTRAVAPGHSGYQSVSAENRRSYRAAAYKGKFARGETVNFDAEPIELDAAILRASDGPLFLRADTPMVRWNPTTTDAAVPLAGYLDERIGLLLNPPAGT